MFSNVEAADHKITFVDENNKSFRFINKPTITTPEQATSAKIKAELDKPKKVKNKLGDTLYELVLDPTEKAKQKGKKPPKDKFHDSEDPEVRNQAYNLALDHGFEVNGIISIGAGIVTAYLNDATAKKVEKDKRVRILRASTLLEFSASMQELPPWSNQTNYNGLDSWGLKAVQAYDNVDYLLPAAQQNVDVYILDSGVGFHSALSGQVTRIRRVLRPGDTLETIDNTVGCYAHSTAVAGIIGGKANAATSKGVFPGLSMLSLHINDYENNTLDFQNKTSNSLNSSSPQCLGVKVYSTNLKQAIVRVRNLIQARGRMGIVNISLNTDDGQFKLSSSNEIDLDNTNYTVADFMRQVGKPNPSTGYKGALFVHSAGNNEEDACNRAYDTSSVPSVNRSLDPVLVVGGVHLSGQPVITLITAIRVPGNVTYGWYLSNSHSDGYRQAQKNLTAGNEKGSNFGNCVDIWAPSFQIPAPFSGSKVNYKDEAEHFALSVPERSEGIQPTNLVDSFWSHLSGTSFAAPHVAGLAARAAARMSNPTPLAVKQQLLAQSNYLNTFAGGKPINLATDHLGYKDARAAATGEYRISATSYFSALDSSPASSTSESLVSYDTQDIYSDNCTIAGRFNGRLNWYGANWPGRAVIGRAKFSPGSHELSLDCINDFVLPNKSLAKFTVPNDSTNNNTPYFEWFLKRNPLSGENLANKNSSNFDFSAAVSTYNPYTGDTSPIYYGFSSTMDACNMSIYTGSDYGSLSLWYTQVDFGTSFYWNDVLLYPGAYVYSVNCTKNGQSYSSTFRLTVN